MGAERMAGKPTTRRYSVAEKEQAVRLVRQLRAETGMRHGTVQRVASQLGYGVGSVRQWVKQADIDGGEAPGVTTADAARIRELEQENRELRRANENGRNDWQADRYAHQGPPERPLTWHFVERTTGFEPATLTLARFCSNRPSVGRKPRSGRMPSRPTSVRTQIAAQERCSRKSVASRSRGCHRLPPSCAADLMSAMQRGAAIGPDWKFPTDHEVAHLR